MTSNFGKMPTKGIGLILIAFFVLIFNVENVRGDLMCGFVSDTINIRCGKGTMIYENTEFNEKIEFKNDKAMRTAIGYLMNMYRQITLVCMTPFECRAIEILSRMTISDLGKGVVTVNMTAISIEPQPHGKLVNITTAGHIVTLQRDKLTVQPSPDQISISNTKHAHSLKMPNQIWFPLKRVGTKTSFFSTTVFLEPAIISASQFCQDHKLGLAFQNGDSLFVIEGMSIAGSNRQFTRAKIDHAVKCRRDPQHQIGSPIPDSELIISPDVGAPTTWINHIPGYSSQDWPMKYLPISVELGFCPGTTVNVTSNCKHRSKPKKSSQSSGEIIANWCCKSCTLGGVHMIDSVGNCWMPSETFPINIEEEELESKDEDGLASFSSQLLSDCEHDQQSSLSENQQDQDFQ
jgi:hypothetical protein